MIQFTIDKLYRYARRDEPCFIGFPLAEGTLYTADHIALYDRDRKLPLQTKVTSRYKDGSIRFLFLRFLTDIPANQEMKVECELNSNDSSSVFFSAVTVEKTETGLRIANGAEGKDALIIDLKHGTDRLFEQITAGDTVYQGSQFEGPVLKENGAIGSGVLRLEQWETVEEGPVAVIVKNRGVYRAEHSGRNTGFEFRITVWAGKPWAEVSCRIINTDERALSIESLRYSFRRNSEADETVRSCAANSNYKTDYLISETGKTVSKTIDADWLIKEANEHFAEVFYGTFFADCTGKDSGIAATIFQAHQNFPKAVCADRNGIDLMLVPEGAGEVILQSGMAREQKFLLHFHDSNESLESLNDRSIVYQMPYRPVVSPEVQRASGVWPDLFADRLDYRVEQNLTARADGHGRAYGMLNFGDSYDSNYTAQGRGNGHLVWCNNEYDYPHACALLFARTGTRRFLDYVIASCSHWMDVDVCHYHTDPMFLGGQWEHTAGHVINGVMVCSHQWVEGLLDYYHFTGDERGLETAIGIGMNVQRLLDTPAYAKVGEANARETGWALRTLTALYVETQDESWVEKCERIVNDFRVWEDTYGHWMAPYTDNTLVRVGFMISVAIGSLMRYYRVFPSEELKNMILRQVDDLIEHCYVKGWGIFYYKELPSLNRLGNNTLLLESLTAAYDLTGDRTYLEYGIETFKNAMEDAPGYHGVKRKEEDAVLVGNMSSKQFAQSMIPLAGYYRALAESGMDYR
ncbi:MAG: hypothetical protein IKS32_04065 [Solobacterium sp.]|nr:hypothetical protein [Solobacterium sp.]